MSEPVALQLAPHPDDEILGCSASLMALRDAGWRVEVHACGLGRPEDRPRRLGELGEACARAGFGLDVGDPPLELSGGDDLAAAEDELVERATALLAQLEPRILVAPTPHDVHHAHELVGRAARRAAEAHARAGGQPPALWLWALWGDVGVPTLLAPYGRARLDQVLHALRAHVWEIERNDLVALAEARARAQALIGPERVFGTGLGGEHETPYADLLAECVLTPAGWRFGTPRRLDAAGPLAAPGDEPAVGWLEAPSVSAVRRATRR